MTAQSTENRMELHQGDFVEFKTNNGTMFDMVWEVCGDLVKTFSGFVTPVDQVLSVEKFQ
jgi:hypothetical protein